MGERRWNKTNSGNCPSACIRQIGPYNKYKEIKQNEKFDYFHQGSALEKNRHLVGRENHHCNKMGNL